MPGRTDVTSDEVNFRAKIKLFFTYHTCIHIDTHTLVSGNAGDENILHPSGRKYIYIYIFIYIYIYKFVRTKVLVKYFFVCVFFETKNIYSYTHSAYAGGQVIEKVSPR